MKLLSFCRVLRVLETRDISMSNIAARFLDMSLNGLDRRPVLAAMMAYSLGLAVAALVVTIAMWRETSCSPNPQKSNPSYLVWNASNEAGRSDPCPMNAAVETNHPASAVAFII